MSALTSKELEQQPERLLDDARRGTPDVVTVQGEPIMLTLPLGQATGSSAERLALAVSLYERDVLSLGLAAKVAGLSCSQTIDELGRRQIPVCATALRTLTANSTMSAPLLVADSGPLIALARLDLLTIPARLFGDLWSRPRCGAR
jgi:antitoxin (DNA-binding transcriptional repressor) of toxin-antitoxin stability system